MKFSKCASFTKEVFNYTNKYDKCYGFFQYVYTCRNANDAAFKISSPAGLSPPQNKHKTLFYRANQAFALKKITANNLTPTLYFIFQHLESLPLTLNKYMK